MARNDPKELKPAGHNAFVEGLVTPMTITGSTILALVGCYVLGLDRIQAVLAALQHGAMPQIIDLVIVFLILGTGLLVDTAMVVASSRFKMHIVRGKRDRFWSVISGLMMTICLLVESMTLLYFFYLVAPDSVPAAVVNTIKSIHDVLFFIRGGVPPLIIAYFMTCVLPLVIDRDDRNRAILARTSQNIMVLNDRLVKISEVTAPDAMLKALAGQLLLSAYAGKEGDSAKDHDKQLLRNLARIHGVPWADVETALADIPALVAAPGAVALASDAGLGDAPAADPLDGASVAGDRDQHTDDTDEDEGDDLAAPPPPPPITRFNPRRTASAVQGTTRAETHGRR